MIITELLQMFTICAKQGQVTAVLPEAQTQCVHTFTHS